MIIIKDGSTRIVLVVFVLMLEGCRSDRGTPTTQLAPTAVSSFPFYVPAEVNSVFPSSGPTREGGQVGYAMTGVDASRFLAHFNSKMSEKGFLPLTHQVLFPKTEPGWANVSDTTEVWTGDWVNSKSESVLLIVERQQGRDAIVINQAYRKSSFMKPLLERYEKYHPLPAFGPLASQPQ